MRVCMAATLATANNTLWCYATLYVSRCSKSGVISQFAYEYLQSSVTDVLPALGTHAPMTDDEITKASICLYLYRPL